MKWQFSGQILMRAWNLRPENSLVNELIIARRKFIAIAKNILDKNLILPYSVHSTRTKMRKKKSTFTRLTERVPDR